MSTHDAFARTADLPSGYLHTPEPSNARHAKDLETSEGIELTPKGERYAAEHEDQLDLPLGDDRERLRAQVRMSIDTALDFATALLAWLDDEEGDADLEEEPDAEQTTCGGREVDRELDTSDLEPSLGSSPCNARGFDVGEYLLKQIDGSGYRGWERGHPGEGSQVGWAFGDDSDAEGDEHDGREPDVDDEPSLGWTHSSFVSQDDMLKVECGWITDGEVGEGDDEPSYGYDLPAI